MKARLDCLRDPRLALAALVAGVLLEIGAAAPRSELPKPSPHCPPGCRACHHQPALVRRSLDEYLIRTGAMEAFP